MPEARIGQKQPGPDLPAVIEIPLAEFQTKWAAFRADSEWHALHGGAKLCSCALDAGEADRAGPARRRRGRRASAAAEGQVHKEGRQEIDQDLASGLSNQIIRKRLPFGEQGGAA